VRGVNLTELTVDHSPSFTSEQWRTQELFSVGGYSRNFFGGSTNLVEDGGQRERGSGGCSPLVRGSTQFADE
jgi:hypothetical protein